MNNQYLKLICFLVFIIIPKCSLSVVNGVKIERNSSKKRNSLSTSETINLNKNNSLTGILVSFINQPSIIEDVANTIKYDIGSLKDDIDTDLDDTNIIDRKHEVSIIADKKIYINKIKNVTRSRNKKISNYRYDWKKNYVTSEKSISQARLAKDAKLINESMKGESVSRTVIFCVILRDKHGYAKKFAFHNGEGSMNKKSFEKAVELGYDVITAERSHAEGQFLQFLYKRSICSNKPFYTHVLAMGCSKKHCSECDWLLKLILGSNYYEITAAVQEAEALQELNIEGDDDNFNIIKSITTSYSYRTW